MANNIGLSNVVDVLFNRQDRAHNCLLGTAGKLGCHPILQVVL